MSDQDKLLDFVNDPENLKKAVEGSMEKRQKIIDQASDQTIKQRLRDILGEEDYKYTEKPHHLLQLLNETHYRKTIYIIGKPEIVDLGSTLPQEIAKKARNQLREEQFDRYTELTPKENK